MIVNAKIRRCNGSQSLRIPAKLAFPNGVKEVTIVRSGGDLMISPVRPLKSWKEFFERGPWVSEDFMSERVDPPWQERDFSSWDKPRSVS